MELNNTVFDKNEIPKSVVFGKSNIKSKAKYRLYNKIAKLQLLMTHNHVSY